MTAVPTTLKHWRNLKDKPLGKWLFGKMLCWRVPYFGTIKPEFKVLEPFYVEVGLSKRRSVTNHIKTVHAIAICNLAEVAAGVMVDATVPVATHRWIPKGMTVNYLKKAETDLMATAAIPKDLVFTDEMDVVVPVEVRDKYDQLVFSADVTMYVTERKNKKSV